METLLWEMVGSLVRQPSWGGFLVWSGVVAATIWLPSLVPTSVRGFVQHFCNCGLFGLLLASVTAHFRAGWGTPVPLLELVALGLTATWAWLERAVQHRQTPSRNANAAEALQRERQHELLNAVRWALWATLSLMPTVHWL